MTGAGKLSKHEADVFATSFPMAQMLISISYMGQMMQTAFKKELEKFDRNRALLAWDGLISKQQTMLASHSVPTMFVTIEDADRHVRGIDGQSVKSSN